MDGQSMVVTHSPRIQMPFKPPFSTTSETKQPDRTCNETSVDDATDSSSTSCYILPALYLDGLGRSAFRRPEDSFEDFYKADLDVHRLNTIHDWLWLAGRPEPARSLHRQTILRREIIITEQADLHLVWEGSQIYIKPLPAYLLYEDFWATATSNTDLHQSACGLIRSYSWLIRYESDFFIANNLHLLPANLKWPQWRQLVAESYDSNVINKRYCYGELRQTRLNSIYRLTQGRLIRGYQYGYNQYGTFFSRNFAWLITVFAYITVALTAMQVGLATEHLNQNSDFQTACYVFGIIALLLPVALVVLMFSMFVILFIYNFIATRKTVRKQKATGYLI